MTPELEQQLTDFYNELAREDLAPDDPLYVPFVEHMPGGDPVKQLRKAITMSRTASVSLLTGMRGNGKTTSLRRLQRELEAEGVTVFRRDMRDYVNRTEPVAITDFLVSSMIALADAVEDRFGENVAREGFFMRVLGFLNQDVLVDTLKVDIGGGPLKATIGASLAQDPTFKQRLQARMQGRVAQLVQEAHAFSDAVVDRVRAEVGDPNRKVAMLFDSLEQIRGVGENARLVHESVADLYAGNADSLHYSKMHALYTIPPYVTPMAPALGSVLGGGAVYNLPSVHVRMRDGTPDRRGLDVMYEIVGKRCPGWRHLFTERQIDRMATATGGDLRDFFRFLRLCILKVVVLDGTLPMDELVVDTVEEDIRREMLPIAEADLVWLRKIAQSKETKLGQIENLPQLARFFDTHMVLNYRNGENWYDVHPLVARVVTGSP